MPIKKVLEQKANPLLDAIAEIRATTDLSHSDLETGKMVDIMTFCNMPEFLDLPGARFNLRISQRVILKSFYMGTRGNENLKLDEEEWQWLHDNKEPEERDGLVFEKNGQQVIDKLIKKEQEQFNFKELILVLGRRSGKTILASVICVYEVYKLIVIGDGDPHKFFNMPDDDEIAIINVALSLKQAGRLYTHIQSRLRNSPFFTNRIANSTASEIRIYTDQDLKKKRDSSNVNLEIPGSIVILCGHSNPDSLAGHNAILILFDELAFYDESGKVTGRYFYDRLKPSLAGFTKYQEGRLVEISSPNTPSGIFHDIFQGSKQHDHILSFQLPTWVASPDVPYDDPDMAADRSRDPDRFCVEYGAQWAKGGIYGSYFEEELVARCIRTDLQPHTRPLPGFTYYLHLDPAKKGDKYAALLIAKERYANIEGKKRVRMHLANIWVFDPVPGMGVQFHQVNKEVIKICSIFHPQVVTYDQYSSDQSIQLLRRHGINAKQTSFNRGNKEKFYQNLKELMLYEPTPELFIYGDIRLVMELRCLKYRILKRGLSIIPDPEGEAKTDDIVDCLAGACWSASESTLTHLPSPVSVNMGYM
jgi:hypothetical protein